MARTQKVNTLQRGKEKVAFKAKRAVEWSTALVAKEEKEAPYDCYDITDLGQKLDGSSTNNLRNTYAGS
jgi:hypothetical protein